MNLKKLGKGILVFLVVVLVLLIIAVGALMIFKPDLVRAVYDGLTLDSEQIEEKKKENDKKLASTINDFGFTISEEDLEKMNNGELSEEDIKEILLGSKTSSDETNSDPGNSVDIQVDLGKTDNTDNNPSVDSSGETVQKDNVTDKNDSNKDTENDSLTGNEPAGSTKPPKDNKPVQNSPSSSSDKPSVTDRQDEDEKNIVSQNKPVTPTVNDKVPENTVKPEVSAPTNGQTSAQIKEYEEKTAELVAKMYALKSQYLGQINGIVASMKAQYAALPKEQRTTAAKTSIANSYLGQISALEAQCDAQVNSVVAELREVLAKSGKDGSLADSIIAAYNAEKETTKAAYINQYSD